MLYETSNTDCAEYFSNIRFRQRILKKLIITYLIYQKSRLSSMEAETEFP